MIVRIKHYSFAQNLLRSVGLRQKPKEIVITIEGLDPGSFQDLIKVKGIDMTSLTIES